MDAVVLMDEIRVAGCTGAITIYVTVDTTGLPEGDCEICKHHLDGRLKQVGVSSMSSGMGGRSASSRS